MVIQNPRLVAGGVNPSQFLVFPGKIDAEPDKVDISAA